MMGCAIGMSVAAACELIYWITLKPLVKLIIAKKGYHLSPKSRIIYKMTRNVILFSWIMFSYDQFSQVYIAFENRNY